MKDFTLKFQESLLEKNLQEIARIGAEEMLRLALEAEIKKFVDSYKELVDKNGLQQIVRNGYHRERSIQTGIGKIPVSVPRANDRRKEIDAEKKIAFQSRIIPRYLRRSKELSEFIPYLYLKGISTGDFTGVLSQLLGGKVSCSASTVVELKKEWEAEYNKWNCRDLSKEKYVYWWADGVYLNVRLEDEKRNCVLVIMGATEEGRKKVISVEMGYRESELSWKDILLNLKERGLVKGPKLAIGDGALGFWKALHQVYPETIHQRCWVHRSANVLEKMPKSVQNLAKQNIQDIYQAPDKEKAIKAFDRFTKLYEAKFPKAVECLLKTKDKTLAFYDFPAEHWRHIRTTNPIESTFASVRLRTYKTKGCGSRMTTLTMVFKLIQAAEKRWQRLHGYNIIPMIFQGMKFIDGVRHVA